MKVVAKLLALWLGCGILVSVAALLIRYGWPSELELFDAFLIAELSKLQTRTLDRVLAIPSLFGTAPVFAPLVGATFAALALRDRTAAWRFLVAVAGSALHYLLLSRLIFSRQRPDLSAFGSAFEQESFPSGHALLLLTFAVSLALVLPIRSRGLKRAVGALCVLIALSLGVSRIVLVAHHPSDVGASWLLSLSWVLGLYALFARKERALAKLSSVSLAPRADTRAARGAAPSTP